MAIHFSDQYGLYADDVETVREQVRAMVVAAFAPQGELNTDPETPQGQLIDGLTALVVSKDSEVLHLANQFNPETATGVWQEAIARIYYLNKKMAQGTVVSCKCVGLKGTTIPAGSIVQDSNGNQYISAESHIIGENGTVTFDFTCTETGPIECAIGSISKIVTVVPGWDSVTNEVKGAVGRNSEGQGSFEQRRYATVAGNAHGSAYSVEGALKSLDDVVDAKVLDNRKDIDQTIWGISVPRHSVAICVLGGGESEIAQAIYERLDAGVGTYGDVEVSYTAEDNQTHTYSIVRPTVKEVYVKVKINYTAGTSASVAQDIRNAIFSDFIGESTNPAVGLAQVVYASRFSVPIIKNANVSDLVSVEIGYSPSSVGSSITLNADVYPSLPNDEAHIIVQVNG